MRDGIDSRNHLPKEEMQILLRTVEGALGAEARIRGCMLRHIAASDMRVFLVSFV